LSKAVERGACGSSCVVERVEVVSSKKEVGLGKKKKGTFEDRVEKKEKLFSGGGRDMFHRGLL